MWLIIDVNEGVFQLARRKQHRWSAPDRWLDIQVPSMALAYLGHAVASEGQQYGDFCGRVIEKEWTTL